MTTLLGYIGLCVAALVALLVIGVIVSRLYTRASKERVFIRTGLGGQKVVMSGGALVLPIFHELIWVNMNTLCLRVARENAQSLITKDRMRVDVAVDFFVRVANTIEAIGAAAQTLGQRTLNPDALRELVEGKFVDALRAVAAQMTMAELQDLRADFVQRVQRSVSEDLAKNGLELESSSLTRLDQTRREYFDENNVFDAEGLTKMTREIQERKKLRNDIEQETSVQIQKKNMETSQESLKIAQMQQEATLSNQQQIAAMTAEQEAAVARAQAQSQREAEQAKIAAQQAVAEAEALRRKAVETANIAAKTAIDMAQQDQAIQVANKSREESEAKQAAEVARAAAVAAEEKVATARATEQANREAAVRVIEAEATAKQQSVGVVVAAKAEQEAAEARAEAQRKAAEVSRDSALLHAEGVQAEGKAVAAALLARNEAQNLLSGASAALLVKQELLRVLPALVEASVKPLERIESIRIAELAGLGGAVGGGSASNTADTGASLSDQVVSSALRYRSMGPMVDGLMGELGLNGKSLSSMLTSAVALSEISAPGAEASAQVPAPVVASDVETPAAPNEAVAD